MWRVRTHHHAYYDREATGKEDMIENEEPEDGGYPPDPTEDAPGVNVPTPKAAQARAQAHGAFKRSPAKAKTKRRLARNGNRILVQQKRRQAIELRKAGATYQQIADQVGYADAAGARKAVLKAYGEVIQEPVAELKTLQIERLNHMLLVLWPRVQQGDLGAMNTSLSIMNKIDGLMGTEAARQIEVKNDTAVLVVDGNKEDYIKALQKMSGAGVLPDGSNMTAQQVPALPSGTKQDASQGQAGHSSVQEQRRNYPPGMGQDIVDAELVEDEEEQRDVKMSDCPSPLGTVCKDPTCPLHFGGDAPPAAPTKKQFKFGVDPTVKRGKK